jgi:hypothetical protein
MQTSKIQISIIQHARDELRHVERAQPHPVTVAQNLHGIAAGRLHPNAAVAGGTLRATVQRHPVAAEKMRQWEGAAIRRKATTAEEMQRVGRGAAAMWWPKGCGADSAEILGGNSGAGLLTGESDMDAAGQGQWRLESAAEKRVMAAGGRKRNF